MVDFSPILSAVAASLSSSLWSRAAEHWNGAGAEQGLDLRSLRLHLQSLWKRGKHEWFGIIHAVSSAATWTRVRRHMVRPASCPDAICRRCTTDEIETDFRRVWTCPANRSIDLIEKSQHLLAEASRHWKSCPVFWPRGNPRTSRNLCWLRSMDHGRTTPPRCMLFPVYMGQEMAREGSNRRIQGIADVGMDLLWSTLWGVESRCLPVTGA